MHIWRPVQLPPKLRLRQKVTKELLPATYIYHKRTFQTYMAISGIKFGSFPFRMRG